MKLVVWSGQVYDMTFPLYVTAGQVEDGSFCFFYGLIFVHSPNAVAQQRDQTHWLARGRTANHQYGSGAMVTPKPHVAANLTILRPERAKLSVFKRVETGQGNT
jgi:hypothetical protein